MKVNLGTVKVQWQGKQPLFYVRRVSTAGLITGHWTGKGWSNANRASGFQTEKAACDAMKAAAYTIEKA